MYSIDQTLYVDASDNSYSLDDSANCTIIGNGIASSYLDSIVTSLVYIDASLEPYENVDSNIILSNFTYYPPRYYMGLVEMLHGTSITVSEIVFDFRYNGTSSNSTYNHSYSCHNLLRGYNVDSIVANNIQIYGFESSSSSSCYVFDINLANNVQLSNINTIASEELKTGHYLHGLVSLYAVSGTSRIENVHMSNYYSDYTFNLVDCSSSEINLTNITLYNVYGSRLFCFYVRRDVDLLLKNINVDGNGHAYPDRLLYYYSELSTEMKIVDSEFKNIIVGDYSLFSLLVEEDSGKIVFNNVTFQNINASKSSASYPNGLVLISISEVENIEFNNCKFFNNYGFFALIYCGDYSACKIAITNTKFIDNIGGYYNSRIMTNGIVFDPTCESYSSLTISDTCFDGGFNVYYPDITVTMSNVYCNCHDKKRCTDGDRVTNQVLAMLIGAATLILCIVCVVIGVTFVTKKPAVKRDAREDGSGEGGEGTNMDPSKHKGSGEE